MNSKHNICTVQKKEVKYTLSQLHEQQSISKCEWSNELLYLEPRPVQGPQAFKKIINDVHRNVQVFV